MPDEKPELVWIHAHVEAMQERDEYVSYTRSEWDAMTTDEHDDAIESAAAEACSNAGGYGASVVDESAVPENERERWQSR